MMFHKFFNINNYQMDPSLIILIMEESNNKIIKL